MISDFNYILTLTLTFDFIVSHVQYIIHSIIVKFFFISLKCFTLANVVMCGGP